jgi:hypothetical protein
LDDPYTPLGNINALIHTSFGLAFGTSSGGYSDLIIHNPIHKDILTAFHRVVLFKPCYYNTITIKIRSKGRYETKWRHMGSLIPSLPRRRYLVDLIPLALFFFSGSDESFLVMRVSEMDIFLIQNSISNWPGLIVVRTSIITIYDASLRFFISSICVVRISLSLIWCCFY